jgi:NADH dehydrogenase (ubiquinone) 1 alpha subcomplex subunit 13
MPQDMPPTGGYEPVQYKRNLPARGFRPATYLLMVGAVCTYGFWRVGQGIREQKYANTSSNSELAREKMWSRIHLIPMLQAEEDRDQVRRHFADKARERELLGAETKVYHSDRYGFPSILRRVHRRHNANICDIVSFARHLLLLLMRLPSRLGDLR